MKKTIIFLQLLCVVSCNVLPKGKSLTLANAPLELGVIGAQKETIQKTNYTVFGVPNYKDKIKLSVTTKLFDKSNYKKYLKSIKKTSIKNEVNFVDSLVTKPEYVELEIIDKVGVVTALNNDNHSIFNYLKKQEKASIVSKIRITSSNLNEIKQGDAFYLQTLGAKQQYLLIFKGGALLKKINLYGTHVFGYEESFFCWEYTDARTVKIASLIGKGERCKNNTKRNANDFLEELTKTTFKF